MFKQINNGQKDANKNNVKAFIEIDHESSFDFSNFLPNSKNILFESNNSFKILTIILDYFVYGINFVSLVCTRI